MRAGLEKKLEDLYWPGLVSPDTFVVWGQASAEPSSLTESLVAARRETGPFRAFAGISYGASVSPDHAGDIQYTSYCGTGRNRALGRALEILPVHYSALAGTLGRIRGERLVVLIQLAAGADADHFSFGAGADYTADLIASADLVIAEVSHAAPRTGQGRDVHRSQVDLIVRTDRPCLAPPAVTKGETEARIARHVAALIPDGAVIQIGLGTLPAAILGSLGSHRDLGIHSGLFTSEIADLIEAGVVTNARKRIDPGLSVAGLIVGDTDLMRWADGVSSLRLRPSSYTHSIATLARHDRFVAINSAIEVDLTGQVNAEIAAGRYVGAVGGSANFARGAAASKGGLAIIALPSTARDRSRIVPALSGPVTTARSDVGFVVTEHGVADLRDATLNERRQRLLAVAHPDHREGIARE